jgi:hypothetical protein
MENVRFRYNGHLHHLYHTADLMEMIDNDMVEVYMDVTGMDHPFLQVLHMETSASITSQQKDSACCDNKDKDFITIRLRVQLFHIHDEDILIRMNRDSSLEDMIQFVLSRCYGIDRHSIQCKRHGVTIFFYPPHHYDRCKTNNRLISPRSLQMEDDEVIELQWFVMTGV